MLVIGVTGGIASGKSTVAEIFSELGVGCIDTDKISRELVVPGSIALDAIENHLGRDFLQADGSLDRRKLRQHIFTHPADKQWLEALLHPAIRQQVIDRLTLCKTDYCIIMIPLLAETWGDRSYDYLDRVLVIDCPEKLRIARLAARDQITPEQAKNQIKQQATREQRNRIANDIITNDLDEDHLRQQVLTLDKTYRMLSEEKRLATKQS